jgi:hypothetical protein
VGLSLVLHVSLLYVLNCIVFPRGSSYEFAACTSLPGHIIRMANEPTYVAGQAAIACQTQRLCCDQLNDHPGPMLAHESEDRSGPRTTNATPAALHRARGDPISFHPGRRVSRPCAREPFCGVVSRFTPLVVALALGGALALGPIIPFTVGDIYGAND